GRGIDDLKCCLLPRPGADVPAVLLQMLTALARPRRGADHLAVDQQIDAGLPRMPTAADQEGDVLPVDREGRRGQRAGRSVATVVAVDQAFALEAADRHLVGQRARRGALAERLAGGLPGAVVWALEVGEDNVGLLGPERGSADQYGPHGQRDTP